MDPLPSVFYVSEVKGRGGLGRVDYMYTKAKFAVIEKRKKWLLYSNHYEADRTRRSDVLQILRLKFDHYRQTIK